MPPAPRNWHVPLLSERGRDVKWNIDGSYKKICRGEASDEVVSRFVKFVVEGHDGDYKSVTKDATDADKHKQNYLYVHLNITSQWSCHWGGFSCIQLGFLCGFDHFANFPGAVSLCRCFPQNSVTCWLDPINTEWINYLDPATMFAVFWKEKNIVLMFAFN